MHILVFKMNKLRFNENYSILNYWPRL